MAHGTDIRRIGRYMRAHGADGSLVAWVEAELDRLDLAALRDDQLAPLRDDLTQRERELVIAAAVHHATVGATVDPRALAISASLATALGLAEPAFDEVCQRVTHRTFAQTELLAELGLAVDADAEQVRRARDARPEVTSSRAVLDSLIDDTEPHGPPPLVRVLGDLGDLPDPTTDAAPHTERMDDLAEALRELDDLDEITQEMSPDEAKAAVARARGRHTPTPEAAPRFSAAPEALDGPPSLGMSDDVLSGFSTSFDEHVGLPEPMAALPTPVPWDDEDLEVPEWTISGATDAAAPLPPPVTPLEEPSLPPEPELGDDPDLSDPIGRRVRASATMHDPEPPPAAPEPLVPQAMAGGFSLDDVGPATLEEVSLELEGDLWARRPVTEELPRGLTDEMPTLQPHTAHRPAGDGLTAELRVVDPEAYEELFLDDDDDDDDDGLTGELRPLEDEPTRIYSARPTRDRWAPSPMGGEPSDGLDLVLEELPGPDTFQLPRPEGASRRSSIQPLDRGLAEYWRGDGMAPAELELALDFDADEVGDGLTAELKVVHDDDDEVPRRRQRRRGSPHEGLTQDLQPLFDPPRARKRRRGPEPQGLTQDLKPILDDD